MNKDKQSIEENIRDFVNNNMRILYPLTKNKAFWNQYLSSLDVIEDCELGIKDYTNYSICGEGEKYLRLYGLLQALFIQQDAVTNLIEALSDTTELPISDAARNDLEKIYEEIKKNIDIRDIRDIRNSSIGHPTKRIDQSYHFIVRISISLHGFTLHSYYPPDYKMQIRNISIIDLITKQKKFLSEKLDDILNIFEDEERMHKDKFKAEKLEKIFGKLIYHIEKIHGNKELRFEHIESINKMLDDFKDALKNRGIELDMYDSIKEIYLDLDYPLNELKECFNTKFDKLTNGDIHLDNRTINILIWFINNRLSKLKEMSEEIDQEYSDTLEIVSNNVDIDMTKIMSTIRDMTKNPEKIEKLEDNIELTNNEILEKIFNNVNYYVEKMYGYGQHSAQLRIVGLEMVDDMLNNFVKTLNDMSIDLNKLTNIKNVYDQLDFPISELRKYFNNDNPNINSKDAKIFVSFISDKISILKEMISQIGQL